MPGPSNPFTDSDLHYVGSITIDPELLDAADIRVHEQVAVVDVDNGARFETYAIAGERDRSNRILAIDADVASLHDNGQD